MSGGRLPTLDEVHTWQRDGWVLCPGLVDTDLVDAALEDVFAAFPRPERFHADPARYVPAGRSTEELRRGYPALPDEGPAFRPEQHRWGREFPLYGSGRLNRLFVHPSIVSFAEQALETRDVRVYQASINARYTGDANYEQPLHTDRNHSFLPPIAGPPWMHVEMFLYLTDVDEDCAPTHFVSRTDSADRSPEVPWLADDDPLYQREHSALGPRGSLLAYRNDTFHRGVNITRPGGARFLANVSVKRADCEFIGYHAQQSRATHPAWVQFVNESTPRELELFGVPVPGDPVWTPGLLDQMRERYPGLDVTPWREALG